MREWSVVCEPVAANPSGNGRNKGGLIVSLDDGEQRLEVTRVAFARRHSRNPEVPFEDQLQAELAKAEEAAGVLNELEVEREDREAEARAEARERLREVLGAPPRVPA